MFRFLNPSVPLKNVKYQADGSIQCACPICQLEGHDKTGNHLKIWPNAAFSCVVSNDKAHTRAIRAILRSTSIPEVEDVIVEDRIKVDTIYPESTLDKLIPEYTYWLDRGISEDVLKRVGGGVASADVKSKLSGRYCFPCRDISGRIVGFAGRQIVVNSFSPKWKLVGPKSHFLFPHSAASAIREAREVILVESIGCVLSCLSAGYGQVFSLFGIKLSSAIIAQIVALSPRRVLVATNNEGSGIGNRAAEEIKIRLGRFINEDRIVVKLPSRKDFNLMTGDEIRGWYAS